MGYRKKKEKKKKEPPLPVSPLEQTMCSPHREASHPLIGVLAAGRVEAEHAAGVALGRCQRDRVWPLWRYTVSTRDTATTEPCKLTLYFPSRRLVFLQILFRLQIPPRWQVPLRLPRLPLFTTPHASHASSHSLPTHPPRRRPPPSPRTRRCWSPPGHLLPRASSGAAPAAAAWPCPAGGDK